MLNKTRWSPQAKASVKISLPPHSRAKTVILTQAAVFEKFIPPSTSYKKSFIFEKKKNNNNNNKVYFLNNGFGPVRNEK